MSLRTDARVPDGVLSPTDPGAVPAAWNTVARAQAVVLPRTTLGGIVTSRDSDRGYNRVAGGDLVTRFWGSSSFLLWGSKVWDSDPVGRNPSTGSPMRTDAAQAELILQNDRWMMEVTRTMIGEAYAPALGFVQRADQHRWGGQAQFRPRFEQSAWLRQLFLTAGANRITGIDRNKQSHLRLLSARFALQSGDAVTLDGTERFERLTSPDFINGRQLPAGDYTFRRISARYTPNRARALGIRLNAAVGDFWSGTRSELGGGFVWILNRHLTVDSNLSWNDVSLPVQDGDFRTTLVSTRLEAALNRRLFAYALVQWDDVSHTLQSNIRVDWIHTPGSDLFVVFDTGYLTGPLGDPRDPRWLRRTGVVKLTYLKAF
jgi:hypothetical protein